MFQIHTIQGFEKEQKDIQSVCSKICTHLQSVTNRVQKGQINIAGISSEEIQKLNYTYRKKDYPTDILTFPYFECFTDCKETQTAGEIVICRDVIQKQAKEKSISYQEELTILLVHGMVHMLGYDHETDEQYKQMSAIEKKLLEAI